MAARIKSYEIEGLYRLNFAPVGMCGIGRSFARSYIAGFRASLHGCAELTFRYPRSQSEAVAPRLVEISPQDPQPEKLLETDDSPVPAEPMSVPAVKKAGPRKADNCGHCGKPLATLRSAGSRYCDRYCAKAARKARATELPIYSPAATTSTRARFQGLQPDAVPKKERDVG